MSCLRSWDYVRSLGLQLTKHNWQTYIVYCSSQLSIDSLNRPKQRTLKRSVQQLATLDRVSQFWICVGIYCANECHSNIWINDRIHCRLRWPGVWELETGTLSASEVSISNGFVLCLTLWCQENTYSRIGSSIILVTATHIGIPSQQRIWSKN